MDPVGTAMLLPPHTKQITHPGFAKNLWADIQRFPENIPGPFSLLHTLNIHVVRGVNSDGGPDVVTGPSSHPLFNGAVCLKEFRLHSEGSPPLRLSKPYLL